MQNITPFLWFNGKAEEAANYYVSIFKDSRILGIDRYGEGGPGPAGSVMTVNFELKGEEFIALNGDATYAFSPATSFLVDCETQEEVDHLWAKLSDGGKIHHCGWLDDKFGVTWQIVPSILLPLLRDPDAAKANRVMQAMLGMVKLEFAGLKRAAGES